MQGWKDGLYLSIFHVLSGVFSIVGFCHVLWFGKNMYARVNTPISSPDHWHWLKQLELVPQLLVLVQDGSNAEDHLCFNVRECREN